MSISVTACCMCVGMAKAVEMRCVHCVRADASHDYTFLCLLASMHLAQALVAVKLQLCGQRQRLRRMLRPHRCSTRRPSCPPVPASCS